MLAAQSEDAQNMGRFYEYLAKGALQWLANASKSINNDVTKFNKVVDAVKDHKHTMMNYSRKNFHSVKGDLFTISGYFTDAQK